MLWYGEREGNNKKEKRRLRIKFKGGKLHKKGGKGIKIASFWVMNPARRHGKKWGWGLIEMQNIYPRACIKRRRSSIWPSGHFYCKSGLAWPFLLKLAWYAISFFLSLSWNMTFCTFIRYVLQLFALEDQPLETRLHAEPFMDQLP